MSFKKQITLSDGLIKALEEAAKLNGLPVATLITSILTKEMIAQRRYTP